MMKLHIEMKITDEHGRFVTYDDIVSSVALEEWHNNVAKATSTVFSDVGSFVIIQETMPYKKIAAIKLVRNWTGCMLVPAKNIVESSGALAIAPSREVAELAASAYAEASNCSVSVKSLDLSDAMNKNTFRMLASTVKDYEHELINKT